jgi:hypothetical protein
LLHFESLLFAVVTALLGPDRPSGYKSRGAVQPPGQQSLGWQLADLARQQNEDRLSDLLGELGITDLPRRR